MAPMEKGSIEEFEKFAQEVEQRKERDRELTKEIEEFTNNQIDHPRFLTKLKIAFENLGLGEFSPKPDELARLQTKGPLNPKVQVLSDILLMLVILPLYLTKNIYSRLTNRLIRK